MINLSPPDIREDIKYGRLNVKMLSYAFAVAIIAGAIAVIIFIGIQITGNKRVELEADYATRSTVFDEYTETLTDARALSAKINTIKVLLEREVKFSELLQEITILIPSGARLDDISLTSEQDTLQLTTTVDSTDIAPILQKNLIESDLFIVADIVSISNGEEGVKVIYSVVFDTDDVKTEAEAKAEAAAEAAAQEAEE